MDFVDVPNKLIHIHFIIFSRHIQPEKCIKYPVVKKWNPVMSPLNFNNSLLLYNIWEILSLNKAKIQLKFTDETRPTAARIFQHWRISCSQFSIFNDL